MVLGILSLYADQVEHSQLDRFYLTLIGQVRDVLVDIQQRLAVQVGMSASLGAASNKFVAYIAARSRSPGGLVIVPAGQEAAFLSPLPVEWLVDNEKARQSLKRLGVRTVGDLARMPKHVLVSHLGELGEKLFRHAHGHDRCPLRGTQQRESVEWEHVFERAIADPEALRRWAVYLCGQVGQEIRAKGLQARTLTLTMGHLDGPPTVLTAILPKATDLDHTLRDAVLHLLRAWDGGTDVVSLGLEAGGFRTEPTFQLQLFSEQEATWEAKQRRLDRAKNGLNQRYGQGTVMAAMLLDDEILAAMGRLRRKGAQ